MTATHDGLMIDWLGYATTRITDGERTVYIDPGRYGVLDDYSAKDGDLVLVTHDHHYDPEGIERVAAPNATVALFEGIESGGIDREVRPVDELPYEIRRVALEDEFEVAGVGVETVTAYNDPEGPHVRDDGTPYHPAGEGVGYRLTIGGTTVYYPGDSDVLFEHQGLRADVFLAPIGGAFTMDRHAAADFAEALGAELVVPVHYDTFEALEADDEAFAADVRSRGLSVERLDPDTAGATEDVRP